MDWLLTGKMHMPLLVNFEEPLSDRLFDEKRMYTYVKTYAIMRHLDQTIKLLDRCNNVSGMVTGFLRPVYLEH